MSAKLEDINPLYPRIAGKRGHPVRRSGRSCAAARSFTACREPASSSRSSQPSSSVTAHDFYVIADYFESFMQPLYWIFRD